MNEELKNRVEELKKELAEIEQRLREEPEELLPSGASSPENYSITETGDARLSFCFSELYQDMLQDNFNYYATREQAEREAKYLLAIRILRRCAEVENAKVPRHPDGVWVVTRISPIWCHGSGYRKGDWTNWTNSITDITFNSLEGAERAIRELEERGLWESLVR